MAEYSNRNCLGFIVAPRICSYYVHQHYYQWQKEIRKGQNKKMVVEALEEKPKSHLHHRSFLNRIYFFAGDYNCPTSKCFAICIF
jgi:hypothetical protein